MKSFKRIGFVLLVTLLAIVKISSACDECKKTGKARAEPMSKTL
ncbi:16014_t:CDS:2 [Funneliformis geosporum]|nr:16014_t:CDS:2 [Funneliformis geosporum]